jgi:predicted MFS family arabinose efflux permease
VTKPTVTGRPPVGTGHARLGPVLLAMGVLAAANSVVFPLLPRLQDEYGLPTWSLGLISASAFLVGLVVQLTVAGMADRGHAKVLLLVGLGVAVAGGALFFVATTLPLFVLARAMSGLSVGCFVPAARAMAASIDPQRVAHNLGRLASVELGGFVAGPVVAAAMAEPLGVKSPFALVTVLAAVAFVALAPRPLPELVTRETSSRPSLSLLRDRRIVVAVLLAVALFLPVGVYDSLWGRYLEDRGASTLFVGLSLTMYGIPFVALASRGGRLADRYGPVRSALRALWVVAPITALYGLLHPPLAIAALALFEAVAQAVAVPAAQAAMARATPPGQLAAGQGLAGAMQLLAAGTTALVAAPVYGAFGPEVVFVGAAVTIGLLGAAAAVLNGRAPELS